MEHKTTLSVNKMVESTAGNLTLALTSKQYISMDILQSASVNKSPDLEFVSTILPILLSILLVNTLCIMLIIKRDKTLVNKLLILDCIANALLTMIGSLQQSAANTVGVEVYCAPITVLYFRCFVWKLL